MTSEPQLGSDLLRPCDIRGLLHSHSRYADGAHSLRRMIETARELGLIVNVRTPRRTIYTAGGVITAPEVVLPSIAIDDWEVRNVKALVVDLPNDLGWGLLGMNYLRRFRMDLNSDEGLLLLEPR